MNQGPFICPLTNIQFSHSHLLEILSTEGPKDQKEMKALALHVADPSSIPSTTNSTYSFLSTAKSIP